MSDPLKFYLELDKTAQSINNRITDEIHDTPATTTRLLLPKYGAFYAESLVVYAINTVTLAQTLLQEGVDYIASEMLHKVTASVGKEVCTVILITEPSIKTRFNITYQALGGHDQINRENLFELLELIKNEDFTLDWKDILNKPKKFPPAPHLQDALDIYGLEYISDAINRLDQAIVTSDRQSNQALISKILGYENEIFLEDGVQEKVDTTMTIVKSAQSVLNMVSGISIEANSILDELIETTAVLKTQIADYKAYSQDDTIANVANLLLKKKYDEDGTLIDVPFLFSSLELYLDSDNYDESTGLWFDKYSQTNRYSGNDSSAPVKNQNTIMPGVSSLSFTNGKYLTSLDQTPLRVVKGKTIITVTAPVPGDNKVLIELFNNDQYKLKIDTASKTAYQCSDASEENIHYLGKTSLLQASGALASVARIGERPEDCLSLSSSPFKIDLAPNGISYNELSLDEIDGSMYRIGSPIGDQSAEVLMILSYNRVLSRSEIHSLLTYIRLKYGANVQSVMNGYFKNWDDDFGSDMDNFIDFDKRDCAAVTDRRIALWDPNNLYRQTGVLHNYDVKIDDNPYLLVVSSDSNKAAWRQLVDLDPHSRYELSFSVIYGLLNPPIIRVKINDVFLPEIVGLVPGESVIKNITFSYVPAVVKNKIEFFNLNEDTQNNCFGIGNISLVRKIYSN